MSDRKSTLKRFFTWRTAITESDLKPYTRLVLLTLSLHMNEAGEGAFPSQELLAKETGMSERRVRDHLRNAIEAGWLSRGLVDWKGRGWKHYTYCSRFPKHPDAVSGIELQKRGPDGTSAPQAQAEDNRGPDTPSPPQDERGPDAVSRGPDAPSETTGRSVREVRTEDFWKDADVPKTVTHWGQCVKDVKLDDSIRFGARTIADLYRRHKTTPEVIFRAITNYGIFCDRLVRQPEFRKGLGNFMARDYWKQFSAKDWTPPDPVKPSSLSDVLEKVEAEEARC